MNEQTLLTQPNMTQNENQAGWSFGSLMTLGANCSGYHVRDSEGKSRAFVFQLDDAERIPDCVNFCAGMSTEELLSPNDNACGLWNTASERGKMLQLNREVEESHKNLIAEQSKTILELQSQLSTAKKANENLLQWLRERKVLVDKESMEWKSLLLGAHQKAYRSGMWVAFHMTEKKFLGDEKV